MVEHPLFSQRLLVLPERVLIWKEAATLLVADLHLGRSPAHRSKGLYLPSGSDAEDLRQLTELSQHFGVERIIILGDFFHARSGMTEETYRVVGEWLEGLSAKVILVEGNHDRRAGRYAPDWPLEIHDHPYREAPFAFAHEPQAIQGYYTFCGHLHPGYRIQDAVGARHRTKAFWFREDHAILPAYGSLTSLTPVDPAPKDTVYLCADEGVVRI